MFKSEDFEIDSTSADFQLRFPNGVTKKKKDEDAVHGIVDEFEAMSEEESEEEGKGSDGESSASDDNDHEEEEEAKNKIGMKRKRFFEIKDGSKMPDISALKSNNMEEAERKKKMAKKSLGERVSIDRVRFFLYKSL